MGALHVKTRKYTSFLAPFSGIPNITILDVVRNR